MESTHAPDRASGHDYDRVSYEIIAQDGGNSGGQAREVAAMVGNSWPGYCWAPFGVLRRRDPRGGFSPGGTRPRPSSGRGDDACLRRGCGTAFASVRVALPGDNDALARPAAFRGPRNESGAWSSIRGSRRACAVWIG